MTKESYRSIGALIGLASGFGLMFALGFSELVPAAFFGAGGCVAGGMTAERVHAWKTNRGN